MILLGGLAGAPGVRFFLLFINLGAIWIFSSLHSWSFAVLILHFFIITGSCLNNKTSYGVQGLGCSLYNWMMWMVKKKKDGLHETCICSSTAVSLTDTANMKIWKLNILQSLCINNLQYWIQLLFPNLWKARLQGFLCRNGWSSHGNGSQMNQNPSPQCIAILVHAPCRSPAKTRIPKIGFLQLFNSK